MNLNIPNLETSIKNFQKENLGAIAAKLIASECSLHAFSP